MIPVILTTTYGTTTKLFFTIDGKARPTEITVIFDDALHESGMNIGGGGTASIDPIPISPDLEGMIE
jgi:hypothetical protein